MLRDKKGRVQRVNFFRNMMDSKVMVAVVTEVAMRATSKHRQELSQAH